MGGSIGPSGSGFSSGSLGGYLQLQQQNSDAWDDGAYLLSCVGRGRGVGGAGDAEMWKAAMATVRMSLSGSWSPPEVLSSCECSHSLPAKEHSSEGGTPAKKDFERVLPSLY